MQKSLYLLISTILLSACNKVYTGYKFDNFNLNQIKLLSSKDEIVSQIGKATIDASYSFNLKLKDDKSSNIEEEKMLNCDNKNCTYYINSQGYNFLFLRNIMQKYKILVLKFNANNKLTEKYFIEN